MGIDCLAGGQGGAAGMAGRSTGFLIGRTFNGRVEGCGSGSQMPFFL